MGFKSFFKGKNIGVDVSGLKCGMFYIVIAVYKNMVMFYSRALGKQISQVCFFIEI